jgi:hypothetical protein
MVHGTVFSFTFLLLIALLITAPCKASQSTMDPPNSSRKCLRGAKHNEEATVASNDLAFSDGELKMIGELSEEYYCNEDDAYSGHCSNVDAWI